MTSLERGPRSGATLIELDESHLVAVAEIESRSSALPWSHELFAGELVMPSDQRHWLVAVADNDVVGFGGMMLVGDEAHLMNIAVDPVQRRSGIARHLLDRLIGDVVEMGARHLTLEVRTDNAPALELYRHFGLAPVGERRNYYGPGEHAAILWVHDIDHPDYLAGIHGAHDSGANS